ncbi:MAG: hypothetical protein ACO3TX_06815 [Pseudomonadales bacterium]
MKQENIDAWGWQQINGAMWMLLDSPADIQFAESVALQKRLIKAYQSGWNRYDLFDHIKGLRS